jgi:Flp pilus assembly protein CpaB
MPTHPLVLGVRARRAAARPQVRRVAVGLLAVVTGLLVTSLVASAEAARDRWGRTRPVVVATRDLSPGDTIEGSDVEVRTLPETAAGSTALREAPTGAVVSQPVVAGEALVGQRLAPDGLSGVAALVPAGQRAVAVPLGPMGAPPLSIGDLVDVLAVVPVAADGVADAGAGTGEPAFPLVEDAMVVDVGEQSVSVAVPDVDASRLAWTLTNGSVVLALAGA